MRTEDSDFLTAIADELSRRLAAEGKQHLEDPDDVDDIIYECLRDAEPFWPEWCRWARGKTVKHLRKRAQSAKKTKRHLLKRYAHAFKAFDAALAAAEFINFSLTDAFHEHGTPRGDNTLLGMKEIVGGKPARYLLLIGMHARMVSIATEISFLLQAGFPEGAAARARTLYELVVKALLIVSDDSPDKIELSNRYYMTSILEWKTSHADQLDKTTKEALARARRRWGNSFFKGDNNWALPAISTFVVMRRGLPRPGG